MNELLSVDKLARMNNDELVDVARKITGRLNNEDWQQLVYDLRVSGHIHAYMETAPLLLQRFLKLEIDLDRELSKRSAAAPLLSSLSLNPRRPRAEDRQLLAEISSQDRAAAMNVEIDPQADITDFSFTVRSMLTLRFSLRNLDKSEQQVFLENARREAGITFLWSRERWEQDYLIFIRQEYFSRVYAFSRNTEATARLTTQAVGDFVDWLERCWFPRGKRRSRRTQEAPVVQEQPSFTAATRQNELKPPTIELRKMVEQWAAKSGGKDGGPPSSELPKSEDDPFTW
jgi:hypothetical protein